MMKVHNYLHLKSQQKPISIQYSFRLLLLLVLAASICFKPIKCGSTGNKVDYHLGSILNKNSNDGFNLDSKIQSHDDPEVFMTPLEIVRKWGYAAEKHSVVTRDGYVLEIHRVTGKMANNTQYSSSNQNHNPDEHGAFGINFTASANIHNTERPVVFFQHGLLSASSNWVTNLPNESAAYLFSDAGFDVWMGNFRGNTFGRGHLKYSSKSRDFWQFSWDEMAKYDLPAMIDYILKYTNKTNLYYVGHSEGTLTAFAALARNYDRIQDKIKQFFALGPVTTVGYIRGFLRHLSNWIKQLKELGQIIHWNQFLPHERWQTVLASIFCANVYTERFCDDLLLCVGGNDSGQLNISRVPVYLGHVPAGTSVQNMIHFGQMVESGRFQMHDFGSVDQNRKHYSQDTAPYYRVEDIKTVPIYLFSGSLDTLATPRDVKGLIKKLAATKLLMGSYNFADFNHIDFIWGMKAADRVYKPIIRIIQRDIRSS